MSKKRIISLVFVLVGILFVVVAVRPPSAQAALPMGITLTPTGESPTNTPVAPTNSPPAPAPTATPSEGIVPPSEATSTPVVSPQPTSEPSHKEKVKATAVPILPTTGEIPPDSPFGGPFIFGILAAGILIGLAIGLGLRKFIRGGSWVSLFLSSRR